MDIIGLLVGVLSLGLGAAGLSGRFDAPMRPRLYRRSGNVTDDQHRRGQRVGGALLVAGGVLFVAFAALRSRT